MDASNVVFTECCHKAITTDQRFCPSCGWEARILPVDERCGETPCVINQEKREKCQHDWVDATNGRLLKSLWICRNCGATFDGSTDSGDSKHE